MKLFIFSLIFSLFIFAQKGFGSQAPDNVVILIDGSGSMENEIGRKDKMTAAKLALIPALDRLTPETNFGCIVFSRNANGWVYPLGPFDRKKVWDSVKGIEAGGSTPLGKHMKMAADALLEQREKNFNYGTYRLIVVTDGEASDDDLMRLYAKELVGRGISLDVIGVGMRQAHTLKTLANQYVAANDAASLREAVTSFLAEVPNPGSGDATSEDVYAFLDVFGNDETTLAVIDILSEGGNQPLGQLP
ncbi:MAG: vWA domain-containing protein [Verrucomicrobiota bacterium]